MKISFVLSEEGITGGIRAVFECANRLKANGHTVNIACPLIPPKILPKSRIRAVASQIKYSLKQLIKGNKIDWFKINVPLIRIPYLSPIFEWMLPDADIVIATAWQTAFFVNKLSPKKGRKMYFVQHYEVWDMWDSEECWEKAGGDALAMAEVVPSDPYLLKLKRLVDSTYTMPLIKFTTSSFLEDLLVRKLRQKSFGRVPIGVNLQEFYPQEEKSHENVILLPFRGIGWKGGLDGLKAVETVRSKFHDVKIVMFGPEGLKKYVPDGVEYLGTIYGSKLRKAYSSANIFISPTWVEGWGCPQMEAMACRTAVVTTNVGAVNEYAINGDTAIIVPPKEPEKMAEAVIDLLQDSKKRNMIAEKGYHYIQSFTWERTVDQLERILNQALGQRP